MPEPITADPIFTIDRTPTSSIDAILALGIDKAGTYAHPVLAAKLKKLGLDDANAAQKASNLIDSAGKFAFDLIDVVTDLKAVKSVAK